MSKNINARVAFCFWIVTLSRVCLWVRLKRTVSINCTTHDICYSTVNLQLLQKCCKYVLTHTDKAEELLKTRCKHKLIYRFALSKYQRLCKLRWAPDPSDERVVGSIPNRGTDKLAGFDKAILHWLLSLEDPEIAIEQCRCEDTSLQPICPG